MALPLSTPTAAEAYDLIRSRGRHMRELAMLLQAQLVTGSVQSAFLLDVASAASVVVTEVMGVRSTPGLTNYSRAQLGADDTLDVTAMLTASVEAIAAIGAAIRSEYPRDTDGFLLDRRWQADGQVRHIDLPAGSLTATSAAITAFLATLA